jgi:hypothetical protein
MPHNDKKEISETKKYLKNPTPKYAGYVRKLNRDDRFAVEKLRQEVLCNADGFTADPSAVAWNESDDKNLVLGIFLDCGKLIASMRVEIVYSAEDLKSKLDFDGLENHLELPLGLLGKAVTHPLFRSMGLHNYLREISYHYLYKKVQFVVGTIIRDAHRVPLMRQLGYEFIENPEGWRRFGYKSDGGTLIAYLNLDKHFLHAIKVLAEKNRELKLDFKYLQTHSIA